MRQTFQVQAAHKAVPVARSTSAGFTLLETAVALAVCVLVAGAVASSLGTSLRAERQAVQLGQQRRALDHLQLARRVPGARGESAAGPQAEWQTTEATFVTAQAETTTVWRVWEIRRPGDVQQRDSVALRE